MKESYKILKLCKHCATENSWELTKFEAAFTDDAFRKFGGVACPKCSSTEYQSMSLPHVTLDQELFVVWSTDDSLYFDQQDEAICLAEMDNLVLILGGIDNEAYTIRKRAVLLEALCILFYDNTHLSEVDEYSAETLISMAERVKIVKPELEKRKQQLIETETPYSDYVQEVIYPLIDIPYMPRNK